MKKSEKKEQNLLEKTAKIYQYITRDSMDGFLIIDLQGQFMDVNDAYCRLTGYNRKELLKMNISDVEIREKKQEIIRHLQQIKKSSRDRFFTQHRKKHGEIIELEVSANYADHLGGLIFVFLRDITGIKKTESDQYINRPKSRKILEGQLTDSYRHLGSINRKITVLLELEKYSKSKKYKQEIIDHILNLAMSISDAPSGYLYGSKKRGKFDLLSYRGIEEEQKEKIKVVSARTVGLLKYLIKKGILSGDIKRYEAELLALDNKLEYFITLPLAKGTTLGGFIFLGFDKKKNVDAQDLEFLDVFAMHASNTLTKAGVFK